MSTKPVVIKFFAPIIDATTNALMSAIDQKMSNLCKVTLGCVGCDVRNAPHACTWV